MATRCLSPNPSRPQNLRPKTPDSSSSSRKSSNSNPFKASNPSDALQRNSGSKARAAPSSPSLRSSFEQKENERDLNCSRPTRVRSPGMPCSKCVKNFMAPTISASSKATAASPRRKILAEKNEVVRSSLTSVSDSHESPAAEEAMPKPRPGCGLQNAANLSSDGVCSEEIVPKSAMDVGFQETSDGSSSIEVDLELGNLQPVIVSSSSSLSPAIVPPYDPKSNYLSPRPQFLRYRPNPRIEHYLNKEKVELFDIGDGARLEDSFSSESCEATSGQTEEVHSSSLQKDLEEVSSSNEVEARGDTHAALVSEPELVPNSNNKHIKSRSIIKFKFIPLLLVLVTVFLHVPLSDSPIISSSTMSFRNHSTGSSVNLKKVARALGHWSIYSFSYYTTVVSLPKEEEFSVIYLANLTAASVIDEGLQKNEQIVEKTEMEQVSKKNMEEESTKGQEIEREFEVEDSGAVQDDDAEYESRPWRDDDDAEYETERMEMEFHEGWREYIMEFHEGKIETELQEAQNEDNSAVEFGEENNVQEDAMKDMEQGGNIQNIEDQKNIEVEVGLSHDIVAETEKVESEEVGSNFNSRSQTQPAGFDSHHVVGNEYQISSNPKSKESTIYGSKHELSSPLVLGVLLAIVLLLASLVFLHRRKKHTPMVVTREKVPPNKLVSTSISGSSESYTYVKRSNYQNSPVELDMVGDSGPSEMSTILRSSSSTGRHRMKRAKEEENLSDERKPRRDSTVSSSSISYGSFTTYEKFSAKKGSRDDEAMTPVRRSSRIRNQIASP